MNRKDALADTIRKAWHELGFYGRTDLAPGWLDGFASVTAEALLDSMQGSVGTEEVVTKLDAVDGSDPERAHLEADDLLRWYVPEEVRAAYDRVGGRCRWWAFS